MNVLAVRQDHLGDVILAGPAIRALAARAAHVTLLCGPAGAAAAHALPGVDRVIVFAAPWIDAEPAAVRSDDVRSFVDRIVSARIDEAVIFTSFHQSALPMALLLRMAGVGRISAISSDYPGSLLDVRHLVDDDIHEVERALSLARAAGFPEPPSDDRRLALTVADANPIADVRPYVVVHPGATVPARAWAPDKNREVVRRLRARGTNVVVTGTRAERDLCAAVAVEGAVDLSGATTFGELACVIADAESIVVGNTGAAHVAAAVGTPVVSLFAPTIPAVRFRPWMVPQVLLGDQSIPCAGCRARRCPIAGQPCLGQLTIESVIEAVDSLASTCTVGAR